MSKGSKRRPQFVAEDEMADRWWQAFGKETERAIEQPGTKGDGDTPPGKERDRGQQ